MVAPFPCAKASFLHSSQCLANELLSFVSFVSWCLFFTLQCVMGCVESVPFAVDVRRNVARQDLEEISEEAKAGAEGRTSATPVHKVYIRKVWAMVESELITFQRHFLDDETLNRSMVHQALEQIRNDVHFILFSESCADTVPDESQRRVVEAHIDVEYANVLQALLWLGPQPEAEALEEVQTYFRRTQTCITMLHKLETCRRGLHAAGGGLDPALLRHVMTVIQGVYEERMEMGMPPSREPSSRAEVELLIRAVESACNHPDNEHNVIAVSRLRGDAARLRKYEFRDLAALEDDLSKVDRSLRHFDECPPTCEAALKKQKGLHEGAYLLRAEIGANKRFALPWDRPEVEDVAKELRAEGKVHGGGEGRAHIIEEAVADAYSAESKYDYYRQAIVSMGACADKPMPGSVDLMKSYVQDPMSHKVLQLRGAVMREALEVGGGLTILLFKHIFTRLWKSFQETLTFEDGHTVEGALRRALHEDETDDIPEPTMPSVGRSVQGQCSLDPRDCLDSASVCSAAAATTPRSGPYTPPCILFAPESAGKTMSLMSLLFRLTGCIIVLAVDSGTVTQDICEYRVVPSSRDYIQVGQEASREFSLNVEDQSLALIVEVMEAIREEQKKGPSVITIFTSRRRLCRPVTIVDTPGGITADKQAPEERQQLSQHFDAMREKIFVAHPDAHLVTVADVSEMKVGSHHGASSASSPVGRFVDDLSSQLMRVPAAHKKFMSSSSTLILTKAQLMCETVRNRGIDGVTADTGESADVTCRSILQGIEERVRDMTDSKCRILYMGDEEKRVFDGFGACIRDACANKQVDGEEVSCVLEKVEGDYMAYREALVAMMEPLLGEGRVGSRMGSDAVWKALLEATEEEEERIRARLMIREHESMERRSMLARAKAGVEEIANTSTGLTELALAFENATRRFKGSCMKEGSPDFAAEANTGFSWTLRHAAFLSWIEGELDTPDFMADADVDAVPVQDIDARGKVPFNISSAAVQRLRRANNNFKRSVTKLIGEHSEGGVETGEDVLEANIFASSLRHPPHALFGADAVRADIGLDESDLFAQHFMRHFLTVMMQVVQVAEISEPNLRTVIDEMWKRGRSSDEMVALLKRGVLGPNGLGDSRWWLGHAFKVIDALEVLFAEFFLEVVLHLMGRSMSERVGAVGGDHCKVFVRGVLRKRFSELAEEEKRSAERLVPTKLDELVRGEFKQASM